MTRPRTTGPVVPNHSSSKVTIRTRPFGLSDRVDNLSGVYDMTDPVAARQAAKAAERERLTRARERREGQGPSGVSGFVQRKWRWLGVGGSEAVEVVLAMLTEMVAVAGIPEAERVVPQRRRAHAPCMTWRSL
jgi:hypothetical protein